MGWVDTGEALDELVKMIGVQKVLQLAKDGGSAVSDALHEAGFYEVGAGLWGKTVETVVSATGGVKTAEMAYELTEVTSSTATVTSAGVILYPLAATAAVVIANQLGLEIGNEIHDMNPEFWDGYVEYLIDSEWSVGDKVIALYDGVNTMFSMNLIEGAKNWLFDHGAFDSTFEPATPALNEFKEYSYGSAADAYRGFPDHIKKYMDILASTGPAPTGFTVAMHQNSYGRLTTHSKQTAIKFKEYRPSDTYPSSGVVSWEFPEVDTVIVRQMNFTPDSTPFVNEVVTTSYGYGAAVNTNIGSRISGQVGIEQNPDSKQPDKETPVTTTFPNWIPSSIGGTDWLPSSLPNQNNDPGTTPENKPQSEAQTGTNPSTEDITSTIPSTPTPPTPPTISTGDTGDKPSVITGTSSGLFRIWNPTLSQLNEFGSWLWSTDPVKLLRELFNNNPVDGIIGLQVIYGTPSIGGEDTIKVGYVDSGVTSKYVNEQYIHINCGSVTIPEYWGNALDYVPYTSVSAYLPFIGIVDLNANDIVGGTVTIDYTIDVLTGTVLATVKLSKGQFNGILYNFTGSCSVQLPVTAGSRATQLASVIQSSAYGLARGSVVGAGVGVLGGGAKGADIRQQGQLTGNAGAMGIRKPYIIVNRRNPYHASRYNTLYGFPANKYVTLGSCRGFTRVKDVHVDSISTASDMEKKKIEDMLKSGVVIN